MTSQYKKNSWIRFPQIAMLTLLTATFFVQRAGADEKVLPANLTPEQRAGVILEPEFSDAFFGQVDRQYLNGYWKFKPELNLLRRNDLSVVSVDPKLNKAPSSDEGLTQGYFQPEFDASGWDEIPVPWVWNVAVRPASEKTPPRIAFAGLGYYRITFQVPEEKKGKRVVLHFDQVQTESKVWLNGVLVGEHENSSSDGGPYWDFKRRLLLDDFDLDVTDNVKFGADNTLVLRVFDDGLPISDGNPNDGGIVGAVWVDYREAIHFPEMLVDADPNGDVTIQAQAMNHESEEVTLNLVAEVEPFQSQSYTPPSQATATTINLGEIAFPKGESAHRFFFKVPNPVPWDLNCPSLYRLRLSDGKRVLGQTRIGFRRMEVRGKQFFLNGHPIYLLGVNPGNREFTGSRMWAFNKSDWERQGLKLFKDLNLNLRRTNNGPTGVCYDICDEIGLLNEEDFSLEARALALDDAQASATLIAESKVDGMTDAEGQLTPFGKSILRKWLVRLHNHPSVCFLTGGNEIGFEGKEKELGDYMTAFYNYIKSIDVQKRLITPSSGLTIWQWNTPLPADFLDSHDYQNGDMGYLDCTEPMASFAKKHWNRIYGKIDKPLILGECGGYQSNLTLRPDIQALLKDGVLDRDAYVKWANEISTKQASGTYWNFLPRLMYSNFAGVRTATTHEALSEATAKIYPEFIRRMRRDTDYLEGLVVHDLDPSLWGLPTKDVFLTANRAKELAGQAHQNVEFVAERQALAPLAVLPDLHDRHRFAGESLEIHLRLLNDQYATPEQSLVAEAAILAADGTTLCSEQCAFAEVPEHARIDKTLTLAIPPEAATGDYVVRTRLLRGETVVQETTTPLYVRSVDKDKATVPTKAKIAIYERQSLDATRIVLDSLGIDYTPIDTMKGLDAYQVLIIGANSINQSLLSEAGSLKSWLEKGGRILCLEQNLEGPVPFASGLSFKSAGAMLFADVMDGTHPGLQGLQPGHWDVWNGECVKTDGAVSAANKAIYSHYIVPLPKSVIISGGNRAPYRFGKNPVFGMVAGEVKVGKGLVLFSQALATSRYGTDPVATVYLRNLLNYALGEKWTGTRASAVNEQAPKN